MIARRSLSARLLLVKSFLCVWAPHLGYLLACGVGGRIIAHLGLLGYLLPLAATSTPLLLTAIPAVRTVHALRSQRLVGRRHWLEFWVVWAALQQCIGIFQMVPLLPRLIHAHQGVHAALQMLSFCFGLWPPLPHAGVSHLIGALALNLSEDAIGELWQKADKNGDGQVSYEEFVAMLLEQKKRPLKKLLGT